MTEESNIFQQIKQEWIEAGLIEDGPPPAPRTEEQERELIRAQLRAQRLTRFKETCPAEFRRKIDLSLVPNLQAWEEADLWQGTYPGLWLWSHESGRGKTRMLWRKFGYLHCDLGKSVLKLTGQALAEEYFRYHMDGNPRGFYGFLSRFDVIMLDDFDKIDLSDRRAPRMAREIFDEFYSRRQVILVTANESANFFEKRVGLSMGRRIREVVTEIKF